MSRILPPSPIDLSWDHNSHYHDYLLRAVPPHAGRALDIGCGEGRFARRLALHGLTVDAIDPSDEMISLARTRTPGRLPVNYQADALEDAQLVPGAYDYVSAVATVHHMPFGPTLDRMAALLAPGGVLAVLGLYREEGVADLAASLAALGPQWFVGAGLRLARPLAGVPTADADRHLEMMPMRDPSLSLRETGIAAAEHLPGARLRRLLMWRYALLYTKPSKK
ncbi:class I SAM-dependent methyltransferase [Nocardiopsis nanhaiensis]